MGKVIEINIGKVTLSLVLICIFFFLLGNPFFDYLSLNSSKFLYFPWTLITNSFLHLNLSHLAYNLIFLFLIGNIIELKCGSKITLLVFISSVLLGNIGFLLLSSGTAVGISGAVYGFIGAAIIISPNSKILVPVGRINISMQVKYAAPIMLFTELLLSIASFDNVGHSAHLFGFFSGIIFAFLFRIQK